MDRIPLFTEFIYESDLIENIQDNKVLLERQLRKGKQDGHAGAIVYLKKLTQRKKHLLTKEDIQKVQGLITEEQGKKRPDLKLPPEAIGNYRLSNVSVAGRKCPESWQVPSLMEDFIKNIQDWQKCWREFSEIQNLAILSDYHYDFEIIHPFIDGNGRTGRALVLYWMLYMDKEPFIFHNREKYLFYYPAF